MSNKFPVCDDCWEAIPWGSRALMKKESQEFRCLKCFELWRRLGAESVENVVAQTTEAFRKNQHQLVTKLKEKLDASKEDTTWNWVYLPKQ